MRIVAGRARGRRLVVPPGRSVRPTSDRTREAVFNSLASMGVVRDASVVDLFAGSGALGLEAWSRGAATVTFVERDRDAVAAIRANAEAVGLADPVVVVDDALRWSARAPELDLALADPPYEFDRWTELLAALRAAVVVAESDRELGVPAGYEAVRVRSYGRAVVSILRRGDPPASVDDGVHTTKG